MILDTQTMFSDDQVITASAASTNLLDLGASATPTGAAAAISRDLGMSVVPILIQATAAFATCTSLKVAIQTDDNASFSSAVVALETEAIPVATLIVGYKYVINWVPYTVNERYVRLYYTIAGSSASTGTITAGLSMGNQTNV